MRRPMPTRMGALWAVMLSAALGAVAGAGDALAAPTDACGPLARQRLQAVVDDIPLASLSVLALRDGQVRLRSAFGQRQIATTNDQTAHLAQPAQADTLYRIASLSKLVTALGALKLVELGQLTLDGDVGEVLGWPLRNPRHPQRPISLRMLLSHTSTLGDEAGYFFDDTTALADVLAPAPSAVSKAWLGRGEPGAWFQYANLNWTLLGTLMERASGERFDRLMQRLVLQPLGLQGGYDPGSFTAQQWQRLATLYRKRDADERWQPQGPWQAQKDDTPAGPPPATDFSGYTVGRNASAFSPTGGLRASVDDLGAVLQMLLDEGRHQGRQVFKPETLAAARSVQWRWQEASPNGQTEGGLFRAWGLGQQVFTDTAGGDRLLRQGGWQASGHLGEAYGLYSGLMHDPQRRLGLVYLIGGVGQDPDRFPGRWSALHGFEERIIQVLHDCAAD